VQKHVRVLMARGYVDDISASLDGGVRVAVCSRGNIDTIGFVLLLRTAI